ncbi:MAG: 50S ribosomal protein L4 [Chloroflexi bacterium]|nr:50S ribosomal protein L4 [Chloroflexota bacterium]MCL5074970.1 50S ribosomal protein L4 [Chloroflexota bacterium]
MEVPIYNKDAQVVGTIDLDDDIFNRSINEPSLHQAVVRQLSNARVGTASTKTRGEVSGSGAKAWRQKGTGRARQGSRKAPHWKGGGVAFGPHPRSYKQDMPQKARRLAIKSALSAKVANQRLIILEQLEMEQPRTKEMLEILRKMSITSSALLVLPKPDSSVELATRNIPNVKTITAQSLSVVDILRYNYLLMPVESVRQVEATLG